MDRRLVVTRGTAPLFVAVLALVAACTAASPPTSPQASSAPASRSLVLVSARPAASPSRLRAEPSDDPSGQRSSLAPIVRTFAVTTTFRLDAVAPAFVGNSAGPGTCDPGPDGRTIAGFTGLGLGQLGPATLRGAITLPRRDSTKAAIQLWIDAGDLPAQSYQPFWSGSATVISFGADDAYGDLVFDGLKLEPDGSIKPGLPTPNPGPVTWPATLSGSMTWSCVPTSG